MEVRGQVVHQDLQVVAGLVLLDLQVPQDQVAQQEEASSESPQPYEEKDGSGETR